MADSSRTQTRSTGGLHICPACDSGLVQPTRWKQAAERGHWRLWRRCPECEWRHSGIYGEAEIDAYDEELDGGAVALAKNLKDLELENMQWIADVFATALADDLITADDFTNTAGLRRRRPG